MMPNQYRKLWEDEVLSPRNNIALSNRVASFQYCAAQRNSLMVPYRTLGQCRGIIESDASKLSIPNRGFASRFRHANLPFHQHISVCRLGLPAGHFFIQIRPIHLGTLEGANLVISASHPNDLVALSCLNFELEVWHKLYGVNLVFFPATFFIEIFGLTKEMDHKVQFLSMLSLALFKLESDRRRLLMADNVPILDSVRVLVTYWSDRDLRPWLETKVMITSKTRGIFSVTTFHFIIRPICVLMGGNWKYESLINGSQGLNVRVRRYCYFQSGPHPARKLQWISSVFQLN